MNRRILLQVATPAAIVGLILLGACIAGAWYVNRLQANMSRILAENVTSLRAADQMEISLRQLRFHSHLFLIDPSPALEKKIADDDTRFEYWLTRGEESAFTQPERLYVKAVRDGYERYEQEFDRLRREIKQTGPRRDFAVLAEANPLRHVLEPCQAFRKLNEEMMARTEQESQAVSRWLRGSFLLIGLGGPIGGMLSGYGIARGLSRSLQQLSVRVRTVAQHLEQDVGAVTVNGDGDLGRLDAELEHVVTRVAEVGEQLQRQQQEILRSQQLAAVGQLAASVAHEVRNPLTSIKLLVEGALRHNAPRPFTEQNLRIVHGEILRLEQTVQGLLDFARPPVLCRQECDLREIVVRAVDLVRTRIGQQRIKLDVVCPDKPVRAHADAAQLCTVLVNLLMNALDAMNKDGGVLGIRLDEAEAKGEVRFSVADSGPGIAAEVVDRLFTPFTSTKATGSGLGLSICRRVIEEHGGCIRGENRPEGGACFRVTLPAFKGALAPLH